MRTQGKIREANFFKNQAGEILGLLGFILPFQQNKCLHFALVWYHIIVISSLTSMRDFFVNVGEAEVNITAEVAFNGTIGMQERELVCKR